MIDPQVIDAVSTGAFLVLAVTTGVFFVSAVIYGIIKGIRGDDD